jgi:formylglycine-generating enzyme
MRHDLRVMGVLALATSMLLCASAAQAGLVTMDMVTVGNPGNTGELSGIGSLGGNGPSVTVGAVNYAYKIGQGEVTAGQYTVFLNAVAKTDTYGLYNSLMWTSGYGCRIQQAGTSGSYTYSADSAHAVLPVNFVSWGSAARFSNWLTNSQPTGSQGASTTETGSYTLNGATSASTLLAVTRGVDARYVLPTEDEWYKAAFYDPTRNSGAGGYWNFATRSNTAPTAGPPSSGANSANWSPLDPSALNEVDVGSYPQSASYYDTLDQDGNVWEWNEAILSINGGVTDGRGIRGGSYFSTSSDSPLHLEAGYRYDRDPSLGVNNLGFRVVDLDLTSSDLLSVPEPATLSLLALGGLGVLGRRLRRRRA